VSLVRVRYCNEKATLVFGWNLSREVPICSCQEQKLRAHRIIATSKFKDANGGIVFEADNVGIFKIEGGERKCCVKLWTNRCDGWRYWIADKNSGWNRSKC